jgi:cytochrome c biogenesis protein CcdA/thiol-disulfide isomerase/thioredoxin
MAVLLVIAFISGLVTILAPCIWPLLPIILSSSTTGGKSKAFGITLGICASFFVFTLSISYLVSALKIDPNFFRYFAVIVIGLLGLSLAVPWFSTRLEVAVSRLSGRFGGVIGGAKRSGFWGGLVTGVALGIVWTPCAGPILATIATLAATQAVSFQLLLVTIVYVIGVGIPLFFFTLAGSALFTKSRFLNKYTGRVQQVFGVVMIITALLIFTNYDKVLQAKLLDTFPSYSGFLTKLETSSTVKKELSALKGEKGSIDKMIGKLSSENQGAAPNFVGITHWLNTDKQSFSSNKPLTIGDLKGKVVLVDFWTYTCINCIRTLPYVTSWYDKYHDKGFVVIGVHTPEFEFEKNTQNVQNALKQYGIKYPVAQDNDYKTWNAYNNSYWPAKYLIDAKGNIRYEHFGEGEYDKTEMMIKQLLEEAGKQVDQSVVLQKSDTPQAGISPETYLGLARLARFGSVQTPKIGVQNFTIKYDLPTDYFGYRGRWDLSDEFATSSKDSQLDFNFNADKVFLVMSPQKSGERVDVYLDGKLISQENAGKDVDGGQLTVDSQRLYNIVNLHGKTGEHLLQLRFVDGGTDVYAFTFG